MAEWGEALLFGVAVLAFVLGLSSIIMGFIAQPAGAANEMKEKVEYGFFGVAGLVISLLFYIAIVW